MTSNIHTLLKERGIAFVLLCSAFALIFNPLTKFPYTFVCIIAFVLISTWFQEKSLSGLNIKKLKAKDVIAIPLLFVAIEAFADFILQPLVTWLFSEPADYSSFSVVEGNQSLYLKYLLYMWISAAIGEELLFRGFAFLQLRKIVGQNNVLIVLFSAVLFSLPHLYQGISGLVVTFFFGLIFGAVYLRFKNIWINILVHGLIDTFLSNHGVLWRTIVFWVDISNFLFFFWWFRKSPPQTASNTNSYNTLLHG